MSKINSPIIDDKKPPVKRKTALQRKTQMIERELKRIQFKADAFRELMKQRIADGTIPDPNTKI